MNATLLQQYESACDAAFKNEACTDVAAGTVPAACKTVP
jgi:hypothetical protein